MKYILQGIGLNYMFFSFLDGLIFSEKLVIFIRECFSFLCKNFYATTHISCSTVLEMTFSSHPDLFYTQAKCLSMASILFYYV